MKVETLINMNKDIIIPGALVYSYLTCTAHECVLYVLSEIDLVEVATFL